MPDLRPLAGPQSCMAPHVALPDAGWYRPSTQASQLGFRVWLWDRPAAQSIQLACFFWPWYLPAAQLMHSLCAALPW